MNEKSDSSFPNRAAASLAMLLALPHYLYACYASCKHIQARLDRFIVRQSVDSLPAACCENLRRLHFPSPRSCLCEGTEVSEGTEKERVARGPRNLFYNAAGLPPRSPSSVLNS